MNIVDRRLNPKGKSHTNRQRFIRLARETLREAVARSIKERPLGDVDTKEVVHIPKKRIQEPRFHHDSRGGYREHVLPGNKEFVQGDTLPKPEASGGAGGGREGSPDGEGEDNFQFALSRDEYLDILFDELELPDLAKTHLKEVTALRTTRAGYSHSGSPSNINLVRTMRNSLARRIALHRPKPADIEALEAEIDETEDEDRRAKLKARRDHLARRAKYIAYIDPFDLRFNRFEPTPKPNAQAVMFCLMDVSGSMSESMKDLAKRFFLLLHLFLSRKYEQVDIVFIRHTSQAKEVDEETFFTSTETGGTVVSTAFEEMLRVVHARYPRDQWNIYAAQASDGDNFSTDNGKVASLLKHHILPMCQYFAYIEVNDEGGRELNTDLWRTYEHLVKSGSPIAMRKVSERNQIFPVFRELFARDQQPTQKAAYERS